MSAIRIIFKRCYSRKAAWSSYAVSTLPHPKPERYGVPTLKQSIDKYLAYTKPLVPLEQWEKTQRIALEYIASPHAAKLQKMLETRAEMEENWLFDWWLDTYLNYRAPVVIYSNPGMRMKTVQFRSDQEWLAYATAIVRGVLKFKQLVESRSLPTEMTSKGDALCMTQFYSILRNCRIPGKPKDRMLSRRGGPYSTVSSNHISVYYRNRVFRMEFCDPVTREPLPDVLLYLQLQHIVSEAHNTPAGPPVGLLTTLPRDDWARIHGNIKHSVLNGNTLTSLEHSLFVLCLDESASLPHVGPNSSTDLEAVDRRDTVSAENVLHGGLVNSGNRWFDKTVQCICSRDGSVGVNFEHTAADGGPLVALIDQIYAMVDRPLSIDGTRLPVYARPTEQGWHLPPTIPAELEQAADTLKQLINSVEVQYRTFCTFGSNALKRLGVSPDAVVQVALQLAYARLHPDLPPPPTYESGSLRRFNLGRTDTIRSCSQESVRFTEAMANTSASTSERATLLRAALKRHQDYTQEVMSGQAFDRHLLGLRCLASTLGDQQTAEDSRAIQLLFDDPTYTAANSYRLSTSQIRSTGDCAVGYGPAVLDGYGFCYNIRRDTVQMTATAFCKSAVTRPPGDLLTYMFQAMEDVRELLESNHNE